MVQGHCLCFSNCICACSAEKGGNAAAARKAQSELLNALGRALPDWANGQLASLVPAVLGRRAGVQDSLTAARLELLRLSGPSANGQ